MQYKMVEYSETLDLSNFYSLAKAKGFNNNCSKEKLIDCFANEREHQVWILYYNNNPVGSVAAHSFDEMGKNSYRIAARTCVLTDEIPTPTLRTRNQIVTQQHVTGQFLIPACIEWAGKDSNLYCTSNNLGSKSQKRVHNIFFPALEKAGQVERICNMMYRGDLQTVWKLNVSNFYKVLHKYKRWT